MLSFPFLFPTLHITAMTKFTSHTSLCVFLLNKIFIKSWGFLCSIVCIFKNFSTYIFWLVHGYTRIEITGNFQWPSIYIHKGVLRKINCLLISSGWHKMASIKVFPMEHLYLKQCDISPIIKQVIHGALKATD